MRYLEGCDKISNLFNLHYLHYLNSQNYYTLFTSLVIILACIYRMNKAGDIFTTSTKCQRLTSILVCFLFHHLNSYRLYLLRFEMITVFLINAYFQLAFHSSDSSFMLFPLFAESVDQFFVTGRFLNGEL